MAADVTHVLDVCARYLNDADLTVVQYVSAASLIRPPGRPPEATPQTQTAPGSLSASSRGLPAPDKYLVCRAAAARRQECMECMTSLGDVTEYILQC